MSGNVKLALSHVVPDLVLKVLKGQDPLHILGSGEQVRHYTYGGDLAAGVVSAMEHRDALNEDFNLSTAESTTVRQLAEVIDQMWQTDELRQVRPTPVDEARNAIYYLGGILTDAMPEILSDFSELLGEHGVSLAAQDAPIRFGSWIGGDRDGNPNVTAAVTREILQIQNQHAVRISIAMIPARTKNASAVEM